VDDIAEILNVADANKIYQGRDPIIHFYETFLTIYDPAIRKRRGVYYTPEAVVGYIVRSIHSILKTHFGLADGLASEQVKLLDPAGGTLTFLAEAIRLAVDEFKNKYGVDGLHRWIKNTFFHAFELMMVPYVIGHLRNSAFTSTKNKYFEGIAPEVWHYHIGGYQVLQKYLKERKDRNMDDAPRYCRIVTAISKTIEIQNQIDKIYPEIEINACLAPR